jgi:GNAT superfamily N-acetyltransferase
MCRGLSAAAEREAALEVVLGMPQRERELFALEDEAGVVRQLADEVVRAEKPVWLTVTTQRPDEAAAVLEQAGLDLFAERKLLMSISLRDHPTPATSPEYRLELGGEGALEYARVLDSRGDLAARGMMAVVGGDAVMHDIHTDPAHRRRGLGSVVMGMLSRRALQRGAGTGLLMATTDGAYLYGKLGWSTEATMLTATTPARVAA